MGTLKDRLNDDLHTAMKARDELTTSTLRMALAAVRNAEVAGTQARDLSDDEVLGGPDQGGEEAARGGDRLRRRRPAPSRRPRSGPRAR